MEKLTQSLTLRLDDEQRRRLEAEAQRRGLNPAALVRKALAAVLPTIEEEPLGLLDGGLPPVRAAGGRR